jgi:hypothetical protein
LGFEIRCRAPYAAAQSADVRVRLTNNDRWFFIQLYRWFPSILKVLTIIRCPFRKPYPEIDLDYTRFKFPVLAFKFPVPLQKFPVPMSREFRSKSD